MRDSCFAERLQVRYNIKGRFKCRLLIFHQPYMYLLRGEWATHPGFTSSDKLLHSAAILLWHQTEAYCCSLLCRGFDTGLAECCHQEHVSLMAYSPLAMGLLTVRHDSIAPWNSVSSKNPMLPQAKPPEQRVQSPSIVDISKL